MLGIIALEGAKQLITGGIQERRKSQDFEWDFKQIWKTIQGNYPEKRFWFWPMRQAR